MEFFFIKLDTQCCELTAWNCTAPKGASLAWMIRVMVFLSPTSAPFLASSITTVKVSLPSGKASSTMKAVTNELVTPSSKLATYVVARKSPSLAFWICVGVECVDNVVQVHIMQQFSTHLMEIRLKMLGGRLQTSFVLISSFVITSRAQYTLNILHVGPPLIWVY